MNSDGTLVVRQRKRFVRSLELRLAPRHPAPLIISPRDFLTEIAVFSRPPGSYDKGRRLVDDVVASTEGLRGELRCVARHGVVGAEEEAVVGLHAQQLELLLEAGDGVLEALFELPEADARLCMRRRA